MTKPLKWVANARLPVEQLVLPTDGPDPRWHWCPKCREHKPATAFAVTNPTYCAPCSRLYQQARPKDRMARRAVDLRINYGITLATYDALWTTQQGRCAACRQAETKIDPRTQELRWLCVDHDHATGRVRGLLCVACNSALGHLQDDPARIRGLLAYAEQVVFAPQKT